MLASDVRNKAINIALGLFFCFLYIFFSMYYSNNFILESDTERYYHHFLEFDGDIFLFGLEFVIGMVFWLVKIFSSSFSCFVFFILLLWVPLIYILGCRSLSNPEYVVVIIFFLTPLFFVNAIFLIRQYMSILFFVYFILLTGRRLRYAFAFLSVFSHLSALLLFFFTSNMMLSIVSRFWVRLFLVILSLLFFVLEGSLVSIFLNLIYDVFHGGYYVVDRKLATLLLGGADRGDALSGGVIILSFFTLLFLLFDNDRNASLVASKLNVLIFISVCLLFLLAEHPIIANRVAIVPYFFSVPVFIYACSNFMKCLYLKFKFSSGRKA